MKVQELIQDLLLADPEAEVLMSSDSEGNSIKPMFGGDPYSLVAWDGDDVVEVEEDDFDGKLNAIVLWPV